MTVGRGNTSNDLGILSPHPEESTLEVGYLMIVENLTVFHRESDRLQSCLSVTILKFYIY